MPPANGYCAAKRRYGCSPSVPKFAAANPAEEILPRGRDAGGLRRLMTEMQMLLHEHQVNTQRQLRGLPALNAIWIHGEGMLSDVSPPVSAPALPAACGDDVCGRGIYRLHGQLGEVTA